MKILKLHIKSKFKNLENFIFEDNSSTQMQVIVGQNGSGKSNFLEALAFIFANLYRTKKLQKNTKFSYELEYQYNTLLIHIESELDKIPSFWVNNKKLTQQEFEKDKFIYLPQHLIAYYSGVSERLKDISIKYKDDAFFYLRDRHSKLAFLTCMAFTDHIFGDFLEKSMGVMGLEYVVFEFEQDIFDKEDLTSLNRTILGGIKREGIKKDEAPLSYTLSFEKIQKIVKDLQEIEEKEDIGLHFFHALESLYTSNLVKNITINVKRNNTSIPITELSEGEMQLLLVLGFVRLFKDKECLFLLDEPDTHLNPLWQWQYLGFISTLTDESNKSQVILTSHQAMTIGGLEKEKVRRFIQTDNNIEAKMPDESPKGMGVAGILTEIFGIPSTLDIDTNKELERRRQVESMLYNYEKGTPIPEKENLVNLKKERDVLNTKLDNLGFSRVTRDPLYQKFQAKFDEEMNYRKSQLRPLTTEELAKQDELMEQILKKLLNEEGL
jgi:AAA15 family ATPase/GTPase